MGGRNLLGDQTCHGPGSQQMHPGRAVPGRGFGRAAICKGGEEKYFLSQLSLNHLPSE